MASQDLDALAPLSAYEHGWLCYHAAVARALGSVDAAVLLHKMLKWSEIETAIRRGGWFYAPRHQITEETGLTRDNQETARKKLGKLDVLEEKEQGIPCRLYYRINRHVLYDLLAAHAAKEVSGKPKSRQSPGGNAPNKQEETPPTSGGDVRKQHGGPASNQVVGLHPTSDSESRSIPHSESTSTSFSRQAAEANNEVGGVKARENFLPLLAEDEAKVKAMVEELMAITQDSRDQEQVETLAARVVREKRYKTWRDVCDLITLKAPTKDRPNAYFCSVLLTRLDKSAAPTAQVSKSSGSDAGEMALRAVDEMRVLPTISAQDREAARTRLYSDAYTTEEREQIKRDAWTAFRRSCPTLAKLDVKDSRREEAQWTLMHFEMLAYDARRAATPDLPAKPEEAKSKEPLHVTPLVPAPKKTRIKPLSAEQQARYDAYDQMSEQDQQPWLARARREVGGGEGIPHTALANIARSLYIVETN